MALSLRASGRASGIAGELRIFQVWTVRDSKLVRLESYLTLDEAREAAGLGE